MADVDHVQLGAAADAMLSSIVDLIEDHRAQLAAVFTAQVGDGAPKYCEKSNHMGEKCDRPPGHDDECSWQLTQAIRRYRDSEVTASKVPALQNQLNTSQRKLAEAEKELDELRKVAPAKRKS